MKYESYYSQREFLSVVQKALTYFVFSVCCFSFASAQVYKIFQVDKKPVYNDGREEAGSAVRLQAFFTNNAQTPDDSIKRTVSVHLLIDTAGHATAEFKTKDVFLEKETKRLVDSIRFFPAEIKGKKVPCYYYEVSVDMTKENFYKRKYRIEKPMREIAKQQRALNKIDYSPSYDFSELFFLLLCIQPPITVLIVSIIIISHCWDNKRNGRTFNLGQACLKIFLVGGLSSLLSSLLIWYTPIIRVISGSGNFGGLLMVISIAITTILIFVFIVIAWLSLIVRKQLKAKK